MFLERSTYPVKSRSSLISAHSAVTLSNLTSLDNRLPRETWSSDPHSVSHRHLSPEMLDRAGFCSEDSMSRRPGTAPAVRKALPPNMASREGWPRPEGFQAGWCAGWLRSFSPESLLWGRVLAWRVVSQLLMPVCKRDHGADSELVQRKAVQNFAFHFSSISLQLYSTGSTDEKELVSYAVRFVLSCPNKTNPYPYLKHEWLCLGLRPLCWSEETGLENSKFSNVSYYHYDSAHSRSSTNIY